MEVRSIMLQVLFTVTLTFAYSKSSASLNFLSLSASYGKINYAEVRAIRANMQRTWQEIFIFVNIIYKFNIIMY